jgi:hypothetical protein
MLEYEGEYIGKKSLKIGIQYRAGILRIDHLNFAGVVGTLDKRLFWSKITI